MAMPSFSVIVRTCQRPWFLNRVLESIHAQSSVNPEVVVVCDGGADTKVTDVISHWRTQGLDLREVVLPVRLGRGAAWNAGLRAASGEWIASLDDDDTWEPDFLRSVGEVISVRGGGDHFGVVTQSLEIREKERDGGWAEVKRLPFNHDLQSVRLSRLVLLNVFTNNAFVFPREALAKVGYIREDLDVLEDWDFNVRFAIRFPIHVVARPLAHYRRRPVAAGKPWTNTDSARHQEVHALVRESWIREDVKAGRLGLGELTLLSEIKENWGLRLINKLSSCGRALVFKR